MKPRSDSKLKTLNSDMQASIATYARTRTLAAVVAWLKDSCNVQTSTRALSEFLSWHELQRIQKIGPVLELRERLGKIEQELRALAFRSARSKRPRKARR